MHSNHIGIIGSGNVGIHLAKAFSTKGAHRVSIYSRSGRNLSLVSEDPNISTFRELPDPDQLRDLHILILAVNDRSIKELAKSYANADVLLVHTSGSMGIDALSDHLIGQNGVMYPLQSFNAKGSLSYQDIPFLIEADSEDNEDKLTQLIESIGANSRLMNSGDRRKIHLAAVIVNNFSNHFYALSERYLAHNELDFNLLIPLITETASRLQNQSPSALQTGPAKRGDQQVIETHLEMLNGEPELKKLYDLISKSISSLHSES